MLVLFRLTSFVTAVIVTGSFVLVISKTIHPIVVMFVSTVLVALLIARLLRWEVRTFQFWSLLGSPLLFLASSYGILLFLEQLYAQVILSVAVVVLLTLFLEHIFSYIHLPTLYQPFSIEHLGQLINILTLFFVSSVGFGLRLFLQMPLWILGVVFFLVSWFVIYGTLWASKVEHQRAKPYALAGAILMAQLFLAISFLPSGFYTSAAFVALAFYVFLGLTRASAHHRLSKTLLRRYVVITIILSTTIAFTSQWL